MRVFFVCTNPYTPVVHSQVVETVRQMMAEGIDARLVFLLQTQHYRSGGGAARQRLRELGLKAHVRLVPCQEKTLGYLIAVYWLLIDCVPWGREELIFHCRGHRAAWFASILKRVFSRVRVIFDSRGDLIAEAEYSGAGRPAIRRIRRIEKAALTKADFRLFVSNELRRVTEARYGAVGASAILYCTASESKVGFDRVARGEVRQALGISDERVVVYSGSVGKWHRLDRVIRVCELLLRVNCRTRFLFLTNQRAQAEKLVRTSTIADYTFVESVHPDKIGRYLSAGDLAIIIRDPHPLNASASPVKVAEYILNGLPLIISQAILDYGQMVEESGVGLVVDERLLEDDVEFADALAQTDWEGQRNSYPLAVGRPLKKAQYILELTSLYRRLCSSTDERDRC